jgi:hypothetical protein
VSGVRNCNCGSGGTGGTPRVVAGDGVVITGSGTPSDPLVISAEVTSFAASFQAVDTGTVDLSLNGAGTVADPFILSAAATISMGELADVVDPSGPAVGEVPIFNGTNWEFAKPPTQAPGLVNATNGISGDGTSLTPLVIDVSDTSTTATDGLATYIDSAGQLRVVPGAADWDLIIDKPASFPVAWDDITGKPQQYPDAAKVMGHRVFVQSATPSGMSTNDIWVKRP